MKALISGITGQDGSYLAELLIDKGYKVYGLMRRASTFNTERIDHIQHKIELMYSDLSDGSSLSRIINTIKPDEIYNMGAMSHVRISFDIPEYTADVTGMGVTRILEAIRENNRNIKFYQASSSEMFGSTPPPQSEKTIFNPVSPYACAKVYAYHMTKLYRESYGIFACNGILFNHESPRRGENFVTKKISRGVARIALGKDKTIHLGNIYAKRDWGYAPDYMDAVWLMMQQDKPDDYVIATGESHTVAEYLALTLELAGIPRKDWKKIIKYDKRLYRPSEVDHLKGDPSKARKAFGWKAKVKFNDLVRIMYEHEYDKESNNE